MSVSLDAEEIIKEEHQASSRVILDEPLLNEICPVTKKRLLIQSYLREPIKRKKIYENIKNN